MGTLTEFIVNSPEVRNFGTNGETLIAIIILLLALYQAVGIWNQVKLIRSTKSVEGVAIVTMTFFGFYFVAFLIYGIYAGGLVMVATALQFILFIPLILSARKYGDLHVQSTIRNSIMCFGWLPLIMLLVNDRDSFFSLLLLGIFLSACNVTGKLYRARHTNSVSIKYIFAFFGNCVFWSYYWFTLSDTIFVWINSATGLVLLCAMVLYFYKRARERT